ncbi:MAG: PaaI family thioesterase [Acidobacteriota bacterium]|nr:PaaI family thioesterase [Acidobacteriota bacterium]
MYNKDLTPLVVRGSFERQTFMQALGATLGVVDEGRVEISVPFSETLCQQNGFLHAGVLTSVADSACGYAALTMAPPGHDVLAVEFKINLLRPASAPRFVARARVLRAGRTLTVCVAEVFGITPPAEELVATMLSTVIARPVRGA